jgi:hypothetical protein
VNWRYPALIVTCAAAAAPGLGASRSATARLAVDRKGILHVPRATLRKLNVKPASDGTVCVEFPVSMRARPADPKDHSFDPNLAPQVWVPLRRDGGLEVRKTRLIPDNTYVPGRPGTAFLARGEQGRLVLRKPGK